MPIIDLRKSAALNLNEDPVANIIAESAVFNKTDRQGWAPCKLKADSKPIHLLSLSQDQTTLILTNSQLQVEAGTEKHFGETTFQITSEELDTLRNSDRFFLASHISPQFFAALTKIFLFYYDIQLSNLVYYSLNQLEGMSRDVKELINKMKSSPKQYGYESLAAFEQICHIPLATLLTAVVTTKTISYILGEEYQLTDGTNRVVMLGTAGIDFQSNAIVQYYFNLTQTQNSSFPDQFENLSLYLNNNTQKELQDLYRTTIRLKLSVAQHHGIENYCSLPIGLGVFLNSFDKPNTKNIKTYVSYLYYSILLEELQKNSYGIERFMLNAPRGAEVLAGFEKALNMVSSNEFNCTIYIHDKDSKSIALRLGQQGFNHIAIENASDVKAILSENCRGIHWNTKIDSPSSPLFAGEEKLFNESTAAAKGFALSCELQNIYQLQQNQSLVSLAQLKIKILAELDSYIAWWKWPSTIFKNGHHHEGRARAVRSAISNAVTPNEINRIISNQFELVTTGKSTETDIKGLLDVKWTASITHVPLENKSAYYRLINRANIICGNPMRIHNEVEASSALQHHC